MPLARVLERKGLFRWPVDDQVQPWTSGKTWAESREKQAKSRRITFMRQLLLRATGAAALAGALAFGTLTAFAAEGTAGADSPDVLPAGSIPQTVAQADALQGYPAG